MGNDAINELLLQAEQYREQIPSHSVQLIQQLSDLGYLPGLALNTWKSDPRLTSAITQFKKDVFHSGLFRSENLQLMEEIYQDEYPGHVLNEVLDIDNGPVMKALPVVGEVSLNSRLLHYRLQLFGLYALPPQTPFGSSTQVALKQLAHFLRFVNPLDAANLMRDKEKLTDRIIRQRGREDCILVFQVPESQVQSDHFNPRDFKPSLAFQRLLKKDFDRKSSFYQKLRDEVIEKNENHIDWAFVSGKAADAGNQFIIRVLQIHQWADGLYQGSLDGELGPVSLDSLVKALELADLEDEEHTKLKEVLAYIGRGYFVFNALHFLKQYALENPNVDSETAVAQKLTTGAQQLNAEERKTFEANTQAVLNEATAELQQERDSTLLHQNGKRQYHGVRGFFKNLFRLAGNLIKGITRFFKKLRGLFKDLFKRILTQSKQALQTLISGINYILGRTALVSGQQRATAISKGSLLGDSQHLVTSYIAPKELEQHSLTIGNYYKGMRFSMTLIGHLLALIKYLVGGVFTWPLLLIQLAKSIREVYKSYNLIYT